MPATGLFNVPTAVLLDQAAFTLAEREPEASAPTRAALAASGFDPVAFLARLADAVERGRRLEADPERAKATVDQEREDDRALAERGYRWIRGLRARLRLADAVGEPPGGGFAERFWFGRLRRPRVRGVLHALRILVPELQLLEGSLASAGLDAAFLAEGQAILDGLDAERAQTDAALVALGHPMQRVRAVEQELAGLIRELRAARYIAALDTGHELPGFSSHILRAWVATPGPGPANLPRGDGDGGIDPAGPADEA